MQLQGESSLRNAAWASTGVANMVCITVGNGLATAGLQGGDTPTGKQVLHNINHASAANVIGLALEVLGFMFLIGFLGYLAVRLRGSGFAGAAALIAGFTFLAVKFGSAAPILALTIEREQISASNALLLTDINAGAFVLTWLPYAVFVGLLAVELRSMRAIGKVAAGIGILAGASGLVTGLGAVIDPRHANPVPLLVGALWLTYVSAKEAITARTTSIPVTQTARDRVPAETPSAT